MFGWWKRRKERKSLLKELKYIDLNIAPQYLRFYIRKKSKGHREIEAPAPELKALQRKVLKRYFYGLPVSRYAHGFVRGRSIVSCARPHLNRKVVVAVDIKEFFHSITAKMVEGLCISAVPELAKDEKLRTAVLSIVTSRGVLPQGSPASPTISNAFFFPIDAELRALSKRFRARYTRYADDLFFSSDIRSLGGIIGSVKKILAAHGFSLNSDKVRIMGRGQRQVVTGIVVNSETPKIGRSRKRLLRAQVRSLEKQVERTGRVRDTTLLEQVKGKIAFYKMVDPDSMTTFEERLKALQR